MIGGVAVGVGLVSSVVDILLFDYFLSYGQSKGGENDWTNMESPTQLCLALLPFSHFFVVRLHKKIVPSYLYRRLHSLP